MISIDNMAKIRNVDKNNMLEFLNFFPRQLRDALSIGDRTDIKANYNKQYSNIIFAGLGGSAIGGDLVSSAVEDDIKVPVLVRRDYALPSFTGRESLVFIASYSGNTEETLSAYRDALSRGAKIVVITSGGRLRKWALKHKNILIIIPEGYPPRCALAYSFALPLIILYKLRLIKDRRQEIKKAAGLLDRLKESEIGVEIKKKANISKQVAGAIYSKFPVIYSSAKIGSVALRWRGQLSENSKILSSSNIFPEMNHNEIMGWSKTYSLRKDIIAILLKGKRDPEKIKKRMNITENILKREKYKVVEVKSRGDSIIENMLSLIYIGDFVSFYLAVLNKIDPTPVDKIAYLKSKIAE